MNNPTTRRYSRTMQQAFGPHTDYQISEPKRPMDWQDRVVLVASAVVALVFFALLAVGVIV